MDNEQSLALINQKVDTVIGQLTYYTTELRKLIDDHESRLRTIETGLTEVKGRVTTWQFLQGGFTSIVGFVATVLGRL